MLLTKSMAAGAPDRMLRKVGLRECLHHCRPAIHDESCDGTEARKNCPLRHPISLRDVELRGRARNTAHRDDNLLDAWR